MAGLDFVGGSQTITYSPGVERKVITVFVINDEEFDGKETFYAILTTVDNSVVIFQHNATITLIDNGQEHF